MAVPIAAIGRGTTNRSDAGGGAAVMREATALPIGARSVAVGLGLSNQVNAAAAKAVARIEQLLTQRGAYP